MKTATAILIAVLAVLIILLVILDMIGRRDRIPGGKVIYDDLSHGEIPPQVLYSPKFDLSGKPDLLLKRQDQIIPAEVKNMPFTDIYYESHVVQLLAYCLLCEETYHKAPAYGILRYSDRTLEIPYTKKEREKLLMLLQRIRGTRSADRSHNDPRRCAVCGYRDRCEQNLNKTI